MDNEKQHFLDKNTIIAVIFVFISWFAWDAYMRKKYPRQRKDPPLISKNTSPPREKENPTSLEGKVLFASDETKKNLHEKEKIWEFKSEDLFLKISSKGMGLKEIKLNSVLNRKGEAITLFSEKDKVSFANYLLIGKKKELLPFDVKQISDRTWKGVSYFKDKVKVTKTLKIDPKNFLITNHISLSGELSEVSGLATTINQNHKNLEEKKGFLSFFIPPDFLSFYLSSHTGFEHIPIASGFSFFADEAEKEKKLQDNINEQAVVKGVETAALGTRYFGQALIDKNSDVKPHLKMQIQGQEAKALLSYFILNDKKDFNLSYQVFIGPKDLSFFEKQYPSLIRWVDFGWFGFLSRFILKILEAFYSVLGNWGFSIVLLTIFVRLLLLPVILSSHRSMEAMKLLQPEIQKIREKFKKDPQRVNQEVMALMKKNKANPLGGCLPLLAQIPIFWSLWRVLSNSYVLYQAPFVLWIKDLSWKDPFYVLPILMGVFMFIQQKITPVTMNKEMLRVMQIMPVFIPLFMISLPSGLVLYMLVSTVFGLGQQWFLNRKSEKNKQSLIRPRTEKPKFGGKEK